MNVIFGDSAGIPEKYIVLNLDIFYVAQREQYLPSYCVIESMPLAEMFTADKWRDTHNEMMLEYRKRNWDFVEQAIEQLRGRWNGEVDSFYDEILRRVGEFRLSPPELSWDGTVVR